MNIKKKTFLNANQTDFTSFPMHANYKLQSRGNSENVFNFKVNIDKLKFKYPYLQQSLKLYSVSIILPLLNSIIYASPLGSFQTYRYCCVIFSHLDHNAHSRRCQSSATFPNQYR